MYELKLRVLKVTYVLDEKEKGKPLSTLVVAHSSIIYNRKCT